MKSPKMTSIFSRNSKIKPKKISSAIKALKKSNKSGANAQPDSGVEESDDDE